MKLLGLFRQTTILEHIVLLIILFNYICMNNVTDAVAVTVDSNAHPGVLDDSSLSSEWSLSNFNSFAFRSFIKIGLGNQSLKPSSM